MIQKNGASNGATVKQLPNTNGKQISTVSEIKPQPKEEIKNPPPAEIPAAISLKTEEQKIPSIEDRFLKMDVLLAKRAKWEKLKDSQEKLNKFKLSTDGRSDNITLSDGKGNSFATYNAEVLATVVDLLKVDIAKKLAEVEAEINL